MTTLRANELMRSRLTLGQIGAVKRAGAVKVTAKSVSVKPAARPAKPRGPAITVPSRVTDLLPGLAGLPVLHIGLSADEVEAIHQQETEVILAELRRRFPVVFCAPPVPLAIGTYRKLKAAMKAIVPMQKLTRAVRWWIDRREYQQALAAGQRRVNLDGTFAKYPTVRQRAMARERLGWPRRPVLLPLEERERLIR